MAKRFTAAPDVRRLLDEAGYVSDETHQEWRHPVSKRALDPAVAATLSAEQATVWIAAGRDRKPF